MWFDYSGLKKGIATVLFTVALSCTFSAFYGSGMCGDYGMGTVCARENENDPTDELYALSAVLMDADNGRILLQKNGTQVLPMASTTKIMTCILALELADPEEYVTVSSYAAGMP